MRFRDRLRYEAAEGAIYDGAIRYMMIRPDALMGIFSHLPPAERGAALEALGASVRERGKHSARTYGDPAALLATIEATAPDLGWGLWHFAREGERLTLEVKHSPFVHGAGEAMEGPVCHAIAGKAASVGELVAGRPATAHEVRCAASGGDTCTFHVEPAAA